MRKAIDPLAVGLLVAQMALAAAPGLCADAASTAAKGNAAAQVAPDAHAARPPRETRLAQSATGATDAAGATAADSTPAARPPPVIGPLPAIVTGRFRPRQVVALLQLGATIDTARALAQDFGLQLEVFVPSRLLQTPLVRFRIADARSESAVAAALRADPRVRASQRNFIYVPAADQLAPTARPPQYSLDIIGAELAQSKAHGEHRPVVAIIDTGIDASHADLMGSVQDRFNAADDGTWDVGTHGTGIAGIVAAHRNLLGVAPDAILLSIRAMPAKSGHVGEATSEALVRGLDWAVERQADVINMSLAGPVDPITDAAVAEAVATGHIIVAAAGNGGPDAPPAHPAAINGVIAVTATDQADRLYSNANHGAYISLAAPGVDILSVALGNSYSLVTGTSLAAAHVTGVIALLRSIDPDLTPAAVLDLLRHSAKDLGQPGADESFGAGRVDAAAAVDGAFDFRTAKH